MALDILASSWAKFHRAQKHAQALDKAISEMFNPDAHGMALKIDVQQKGMLRAEADVIVKSIPKIPNDCSLLLGDALHNFRSVLDHLCWDLVKIGADPRPEKPRLVQFPMSNSRKDFDAWVERRLPGVPDEFRRIIRNYQPYRRGEGPKAIRWLRNLSDKDKHRVVIPTVVSQSAFNAHIQSNWQVVSLTNLMRRPRALNVGTKIFHIELATSGIPKCKVNVKSDFTVYPSLGRGLHVSEIVRLIRANALEILTEFDKRL